MNASKQFLIKHNFIPIKVWKVPSKSEKGIIHTVLQFNDEKFECDCYAGTIKKPCRHKRIVYNKIHNITKSEYQTL